MPNAAPIVLPTVANLQPPFPCRQEQTNGDNTYNALSFVYLTSGALAKVATAATACYGLCPDQSHASTDSPVDAIWGQRHSCIDPNKAQFVVNVTTTGGTIGSSTTTQSDVSIGTGYGVYVQSGGSYDGYAFLNGADTTNDFFRVVGYYTADATDDYNGRVIVEVVNAVIQ